MSGGSYIAPQPGRPRKGHVNQYIYRITALTLAMACVAPRARSHSLPSSGMSSSLPGRSQQDASPFEDRFVKPVVEQLRAALAKQGDPKAIKFFDQMTIKIRPGTDMSSGSRAYYEGTHPVIELDGVLASSYAGIGRLAAFIATTHTSDALPFDTLLQTQNASVCSDIRAHPDRTPVLKFEVADTGPYAEYLESEGGLELKYFVAFLLLHELEHYELGQVQRPVGTLKEQRLDEEGADSFAARAANTLRYPMASVIEVLSALDLFDRLLDTCGSSSREESDNHPSWKTRFKAVDGLLALIPPHTNAFVVLESMWSFEGTMVGFQLTFPNDPARDGALGDVVMTGDLTPVAISYSHNRESLTAFARFEIAGGGALNFRFVVDHPLGHLPLLHTSIFHPGADARWVPQADRDLYRAPYYAYADQPEEIGNARLPYAADLFFNKDFDLNPCFDQDIDECAQTVAKAHGVPLKAASRLATAATRTRRRYAHLLWNRFEHRQEVTKGDVEKLEAAATHDASTIAGKDPAACHLYTSIVKGLAFIAVDDSSASIPVIRDR